MRFYLVSHCHFVSIWQVNLISCHFEHFSLAVSSMSPGHLLLLSVLSIATLKKHRHHYIYYIYIRYLYQMNDQPNTVNALKPKIISRGEFSKESTIFNILCTFLNNVCFN